MKIHVLASGSKGNMTYLKVGNINLFIDAGISFKAMQNKMIEYNEDLKQIDTLLITHEHLDHIKGLKALLKQGNIKKTYMTKGTYNVLDNETKELLANRLIFIGADESFQIDNLLVKTIMLSHDAHEPIGFVFYYENKKYVHLTDTGYVDESYFELLKDANCYLLEANHDPLKLMQSSRPFLLRKRILGETGHLSNQDAAIVINKVLTKQAVWIVAHISEDCNTKQDIEEAIVAYLDDPTLVDVYYASQVSLPVIVL